MNATVIVNRRAKKLRAHGPIFAAIRRAAERWDGRLAVVETGSLDELRAATDAVADAAGRRREGTSDRDHVVLFAGGDGSYMAGTTALVASCARANVAVPPLGLLPGGTVGTVARNWGLLGRGLGASNERAESRHAEALLTAVLSSDVRVRERPTLRVTGRDASRIGFIVGAGLVARFFEIYEGAGAGGYGTAARIVARTFASSLVGGRLARRVLEPIPCAIDVDGIPAPFARASLLCASVVRDLGLGMQLLYRAAEHTDRFHVVASPLGPARLGPQMPLVLAGRPLVGPRIDTLAREVSVRFPNGEGAYVLDGDLFFGDVTIAAGPALRVVERPNHA